MLPVNAYDIIKNYLTSNNIEVADEIIQGLISELQVVDLFALVKIYLDITWDDEQTNSKLKGIMERGKKYLNKIAGTELDYLIEDNPQALLFDYCRYARSNALEEFQNNYLHELLSLQMSEEVAKYEIETTESIV